MCLHTSGTPDKYFQNLCARVEEGRESGMASVLSTVNMSFSIGMMIGPITSGVVKDTFDLPPVFYFVGSTAVGGVLIFYLLVRKR